MITNICLLLEALSIYICLHYLYGEKFKLNIETVSCLAIHMIVLTAVNYYNIPQIYTMIIYPVIVVYSGVRFGLKLKTLIVNNILNIAIASSIQYILYDF